jgi:hypothetical protein
VRFPPSHGQPDASHAAPPDLQHPAAQRRFERVDGCGAGRLGGHETRAVRAAEFLVGGEHDAHRAAGRLPADQVERMQQRNESALHVEHARPGGPVVVDAEGHFGQRADRPHRVEVAQHQHVRVGSFAEAGHDVLAVGLGFCPDAGQQPDQHVTQFARRTGRRLVLDELPQRVDQVSHTSFRRWRWQSA